MSDWTAEEDATLRANYGTLGYLGCLPLLPGRTLKAIKVHANVLGIKGPSVGRKIVHVSHDCPVCGNLVQVRPRETAYDYNHRLTCSRECRFKLSGSHQKGRVHERGTCDWDNLVAALAARDGGDHSLLQRRLA